MTPLPGSATKRLERRGWRRLRAAFAVVAVLGAAVAVARAAPAGAPGAEPVAATRPFVGAELLRAVTSAIGGAQSGLLANDAATARGDAATPEIEPAPAASESATLPGDAAAPAAEAAPAASGGAGATARAEEGASPGEQPSATARARTIASGAASVLAPSAADMVLAAIGDIPAGEMVTVVFDATIADPLPAGVSTVQTQATISGDNFASFMSHDPDGPPPPPNAPTVTGLDAACVPALTPTSANVGALGAVGDTFDVTAPPACTWTATTGSPFVNVTGGAAGTGNGTVTYDVAANGTALARMATITVAGNTGDPDDGSADFTIDQAGAVCTLNLNPNSSGPHGAGGAASSFAVETLVGCNWSAVASDPAVMITGGTPGSGNGTIDFNLGANPTALVRNFAITVTVANNGLMADHTISQSAAVCAIAVDPVSSTFGFPGGGGAFSVQSLVGCDWTAVASDPAVMITGGTPGTANGAIAFDVAPNPLGTPRNFGITVTVTGGAPAATHTISQDALACAPTATPPSASFGPAGGSDGFDLGTVAACSWTAAASDPAVTITSANAGDGPGTINYDVAGDLSGASHIFTIDVSFAATGESVSHTISQDGLVCAPTLTPPSATFGPTGGPGDFQLDTDPLCAWTAVASDPAVTITGGAAGTGDDTISYDLTANPGGAPRNFTIDVSFAATSESGSHSISQDPLVCSPTLTPPSATIPAAGGSASFAIDTFAGCSWTATPSDPAVTITSAAAGTDDGTVDYDVAANPAGTPRAFTIDVAFAATSESAAHTISQDALVCAPTLTPPSATFGPGGGSASFAIDTFAGCAWTATPSDPAVTISSAAAGTDDGTVDYDVATNPAGTPRAFTIDVAFAATSESGSHSISQDPMVCSPTLTPPSATIPAAGGSASFALDTDALCAWTAVASDPAVTITSGAAGTGDATVAYSVTPTPGPARSFTIDVLVPATGESAAHAISQETAICSFTLDPVAASYPEPGGVGTIAVATNRADCQWTAVSDSAWLVVDGAAAGANAIGSGSAVGANVIGDGAVSYTVLPSNWAIPRVGRLTIADQTFVVTQAAGTCTFAIAPTSAGFGLFSGSTTITVDTGVACTWTAVSNDDWIFIDEIQSGDGPGFAKVGVDRNGSGASRSGTATVAGRTLTVVQSADDGGAFALAPQAVGFPGAGGAGQLHVQSISTLRWTPVPDVPWITIVAPGRREGPGMVEYTVNPNPSPEARSGQINVGGQFFDIVQAPAGGSTIELWIGAAAPEPMIPTSSANSQSGGRR